MGRYAVTPDNESKCKSCSSMATLPSFPSANASGCPRILNVFLWSHMCSVQGSWREPARSLQGDPELRGGVLGRFALASLASHASSMFFVKNTRETVQAIRGMRLRRAVAYLQNVVDRKEIVPFTRHHYGIGRHAQVFYPVMFPASHVAMLGTILKHNRQITQCPPPHPPPASATPTFVAQELGPQPRLLAEEERQARPRPPAQRREQR